MTKQELKLTSQSNSWAQIGLLAKRKDAVINNLFRHLSVEIPKANGKVRLIAISAFEDKLVEWVLSKILSCRSLDLI